jgi:hypothetical protein
MSKTATLGEVVLVRELENYRDDDKPSKAELRVKRIAPAIVTGVAKDGTVEVLVFLSGGRFTSYEGLAVHEAAELPDPADFHDPDKPDPAGLCAYRPGAALVD